MRMLVRHWLERLGYEVSEAKDGYQALSLASSGEFDLVFLDINMPGMTGLGVLARGKELGASAYLTKPLSYSALTATLHDVLPTPGT